MFFSDIHSHLLYGVDDGASDYETMLAMVDKLYADGVRLLCATPHCFPEWCGDNREAIEQSFAELTEYCADKYPDMTVLLGNELYFERDGMTWIRNGFCKTMNDTRYILVEFPLEYSEDIIVKAVNNMMNSGYIPIIAHAERCFSLGFECIKTLRNDGVVIQVNARKDFRGFDLKEKRRLKKLISLKLVDIVSTDAHDLLKRPPYILEFYNWVFKKYGADYADAIFYKNARDLLCGNKEEMK